MRTTHKDNITIIVPVFNEVEKITSNLDLLTTEIERHFSNYEILVISDGSTDGTNQLLRELNRPQVRSIIYDQNKGKGYAVRSGLEAARGDFIFLLDGGMELHPGELRNFFGLMDLYEVDIVLGSKRHPQSKVHYPFYRKILSRLFQLMVSLLFKVDVTDTQVGMKLFRASIIKGILPYLELNRYGFDLEMLVFAKKLMNAKMIEAPIRLDYFGTKGRNLFRDLAHVLKVGSELLMETLALYLKTRKLPEEKNGPV